ncbi:DUF309 domain-containing protein [Bacillus sp. B15-48]|uniref:DUF309 domain-containing protein n=1 Tax=Bacillus sp. B15-48 TaxID=1548601 RepID=UPI00193ECAD0|nr:DUF309 domain-containing protein [Bacillus sp. B15-48]
MIPKAFIQYLVHFHGDRDYFECHEILEEYWKESDPRNKESILVGFILLAVSVYHHRRNNFSGALRTLKKSKKIFSYQKEKCEELAIDHSKLMKLIMDTRGVIEKQLPYKSINLPIGNKAVIDLCKSECKRQGFVWGERSNFANKELINRHLLRDRTDVILEREKALNKRKNN